MTLRILDAGDTALTIEFGDGVDRRLLAAVAALDAALAQAVEAGRLPGIVETVPTFRSLTVIYDPLRDDAGRDRTGDPRPHRRLVPRRARLPGASGGCRCAMATRVPIAGLISRSLRQPVV
jgi:hypothetical protein